MESSAFGEGWRQLGACGRRSHHAGWVGASPGLALRRATSAANRRAAHPSSLGRELRADSSRTSRGPGASWSIEDYSMEQGVVGRCSVGISAPLRGVAGRAWVVDQGWR